jgi:DNA-binding beta-propeller fold protein YncE
VLRTFQGFYYADAMCPTDARARVFVAGGEGEHILAIDGVSDRLAAVWANESYPEGFVTDPASGKLYCLGAGPSLVSVFDAASDVWLATIPLGTFTEVMCCNTVDHKVYVSSARDYIYDEMGTIWVVDGVGDTLLTEIVVEGVPNLLAYNPSDDVLYAAGGGYGSGWCDIQAISGKADSVFDYYQVRELPTGLVYNDAQHKLYSLGKDSTVTVIDPGGLGMNLIIQVGADLGCFVLNSSGSRLYVGSPRHDSVYVIDCVQDRVAGVISVAGPSVAFCYDSPHDRLYSASTEDGGLSVIDCARNMVVATVPVAARFLYYDSTSDAVYCLGENKLTVVDGQTGAIVKTFASGSYPAGIASAPGWTRVYAGSGDNSFLSVIRKSAGPAEMGVQAVPEAQATVARGSLNLAGGMLATLFDMSGRKVANLHPGVNDVSGLAPGVYFVRGLSALSREASAVIVRKVVITN